MLWTACTFREHGLMEASEEQEADFAAWLDSVPDAAEEEE